MERFTIQLRDPFAYWIVWLILAGVLLAAGLVLFAYVVFKAKERIKHIPPRIKPVKAKKMTLLQKQYLDKLQELSEQKGTGQKSEREAYQQLSALVRQYVYAATGIKAEYYTLKDFREYKDHYYLKALYSLIEECYEPEFAEAIEKKDVAETIERAKSLISDLTYSYRSGKQ